MIHPKFVNFAFWTSRAVDGDQLVALWQSAALFSTLADDWVLGVNGAVGAHRLRFELGAGVLDIVCFHLAFVFWGAWSWAQLLFGLLSLLRECSSRSLCGKAGFWVILLHWTFWFRCLYTFLGCVSRLPRLLSRVYLLFFALLRQRLFRRP